MQGRRVFQGLEAEWLTLDPIISEPYMVVSKTQATVILMKKGHLGEKWRGMVMDD